MGREVVRITKYLQEYTGGGLEFYTPVIMTAAHDSPFSDVSERETTAMTVPL